MNFRILPIVLIMAAFNNAQGQVSPTEPTTEQIAEMQKESYTLKGIVVDGVKKYTPEQILRFTGLQKGEILEIPGQRVSSAIKKLWDTDSFSKVEVYVESLDGNLITLKFALQDLKELGEIKFTGKGIRKSQNEKLIKDNNLKPGTKITENLISTLKTKIPQEYINKGFADAKIHIQEKTNANNPDLVDWTIEVDKGKRVKIASIQFEGNDNVSAKKLRRKGLKNTKQKNFFNIFKGSKFIKEKYEEDKHSLVNYYNSLGYRDAKIVSDTVGRNEEGLFDIKIKLEEGKKYYIGDIEFYGNTVYSTETLQKLLGYKKGDIYDAVGFNKKVGEDGGKEDDSDLKSLYLNSGYLFSNITPIEKSINGDSINLEIRIVEGERATWNKVTWSGNTTTHDHVVLRSLRTRPGKLFSKSDIKRTFFDLAGSPYFDPQKIGQDIKPNPENNTVDIHWTLEEKGSSQIQLQAGYGGNTFIGTLGLTFNNFSLRKLLKFNKLIPQGDGQTLSLQAQAGQFFKSYSLSFVEPWVFGKRPTSLSLSLSSSNVKYKDINGDPMKMDIFSTSAGLNQLLSWPDNYFSLYTGLSYQTYNFRNYDFYYGNQAVKNGNANNFALNLSLSRNSAGFDPIFPTTGSNVEVSAKITPPYSLLNKKDYSAMSLVDKYKWMEYYKIKFRADAYNEIIGKLVLRSTLEMGFLNGYNQELGAPPFERFYMGGTGMYNGRFDGRELIPLRGYQEASTTGGQSSDLTPTGGGTLYNRFAVELRYPISMNQTAKIYALTFAEAGNTWNGFKNYNPFKLKRSVGIGVRVSMSAFGLIGFDFAYGLDKYPNSSTNAPAGWETHFLMNQPL
ncbi:MAG: outer membrane protein assembly factor BamA [Flavobacteriaceae bacterium]|nr:outer membrane protein assembly factor BamA [Flavobacteriaceae bacterium]